MDLRELGIAKSRSAATKGRIINMFIRKHSRYCLWWLVGCKRVYKDEGFGEFQLKLGTENGGERSGK